MFSDTGEIDTTADIVRIALLKIEQARDGKDNQALIEELEHRQLDLLRPLIWDFSDKENYAVQAEKGFTRLCAILRKENITQPEQMPALEFYLNIEIIKQRTINQK